MRLRKARKTWKSQFETLELRALLSGDGVVPPDLPPEPTDEEPVIPGPIEIEVLVDSELGNDIHNGSLDESATELTLEGGFGHVASNIDRDADSDVFRFTATDVNTTVDAFGELPLILSVHNSEGDVIGESDVFSEVDPEGQDIEHGFAFVFTETVPGETYFVSIGSTKGRVGAYEVWLNSFAPPPPPTPDSPLGEDAHGDSFESATDLEIEDGFVGVVSNIDTADDVDVFSITLESGFLFADAYGFDGQTVSLDLLAADGRVIPHDGPDEDSFGFGQELEAGDYFLRVSGDIGLYELFVHSDGGFVVDDPIAGTGEIDSPLGEDIHGDSASDATKLFQADEFIASVASNIDTATDRDVFTIESNDRGDEILFDAVVLSPELLLDVHIVGPDGNVLSEGVEIFGFGPEGEPEEVGSLIEGFFDPEPNQVYFLSIGSVGEATGPYNVNIFGPPPPPPIDPIPVEPVPVDQPVDAPLGADIHGDDIGSASKLNPVGGNLFSIVSNIDSPEDRDVFALPSNERGDEVLFDVFSFLDVEIEFDVQVLGPDGEQIPFEAGFEGNLVEGFFDPEAEGTHYISIGASNPTSYSFNVFVAAEPNSPPIPVEPPIIIGPPEPFLEPDAELGDDIHASELANATELSLGELGFIEISSNIDVEGDIDAFRFAGTGDLFVVEIGGFDATELLFKVFAENGEAIAQANAGEPLEFETLADDTYFLTAESAGEPGQYFAFLQPLRIPELPPNPPDLPFIDPIGPTEPVVEPGLPPIEPVLPPTPVEPAVPTDPVDESNPDGGENQTDTEEDQKRVLTADMDGNGVVDFADFLAMSFNFGKEADAVFAEGDINGDGAVDFADFTILSGEFGNFLS